MDIHYLGEEIFGESLFNEPRRYYNFPQRRNHILHELQRGKNRIFITQFSTLYGFTKRMNGRIEKNHVTITDSPLFAFNDGPIDVFDFSVWYPEIRKEEHGMDRGYHLMKHNLEKILKRVKLVVVKTECGKEFCKEFNDNIEIIPTPVDTEMFKPGESPDKSDVFTMIYAGKITKWTRNLVNICDVVEEFDGQIKFGIVGDGPSKEALTGQYKHTSIIGPFSHSDMPDIMQQADVGIYPANDDCPMVVPEYFASGLPVFAFDGKISTSVEHKKNGFLSDTSVNDISSTIEDMLNDNDKLKEIGKNNREVAIRDYDIKKIGMKYNQVIRGLR